MPRDGADIELLRLLRLRSCARCTPSLLLRSILPFGTSCQWSCKARWIPPEHSYNWFSTTCTCSIKTPLLGIGAGRICQSSVWEGRLVSWGQKRSSPRLFLLRPCRSSRRRRSKLDVAEVQLRQKVKNMGFSQVAAGKEWETELSQKENNTRPSKEKKDKAER